jgi:hypothetical protein
MRRPRSLAALLVTCGVACGGVRDATISEAWPSAPAARVAIVLRGATIEHLGVVADDAPLSLRVDPGPTAELWLVGFSNAALAVAYPGLPSEPAARAAALAPTIDDADGEPLPDVLGVWSLALEDESLGALAPAARDLSALTARLGGGRRLRLAVDPTLGCGGVELDTFTLPGGERPEGVVVASRDRALLVSRRDDTPTLRFTRLDGASLTSLPGAAAIAAPLGTATVSTARDARPPLGYVLPTRLAWDADGGRALGVDGRGRVFAVDLDGRAVINDGVPFVAPVAPPTGTQTSSRAIELVVVQERTGAPRVFATFEQRLGVPTYATPILHVGTVGESGWRIPTSAGQPLAPTARGVLRAYGRGRVVFYQNCWILGPTSSAEEEWGQGGYDPGCTRERFTRVRDADVDDALAIAVGLDGHVATSSAASPSRGWSARLVAGRRPLTRVAAVGARRAVIASDDGELFTLRDGRFCALARPFVGSPRAVGRSPDDGTAIFGGVDAADRGAWVRVRLPPPR